MRKQFFRCLLPFLVIVAALAQPPKVTYTSGEQQIVDQLRKLRSLPDDVRAVTTKQLALDIRKLPDVPNKVSLASGLAGLATEGDFGRDTLQEVTTTLERALRAQEQPNSGLYEELASLVRYEHMKASLDTPKFGLAMHRLQLNDEEREKADFTLQDMQGKSWTLSGLHGKVVLVNFWATWCPPCRKEMPDIETLYHRFEKKGLIVLAISDEDAAKVTPFLAEHKYSYPILLDPGRKVSEMMIVDGIPKTFIYDRNGKLTAQSIDMRTQKQFLEMLRSAGLE
jgi:peroxiredoxin